jgi:hypothetical protein
LNIIKFNDKFGERFRVDLSSEWETIHKIADERDAQKRNFKSSRYWNENSHFYGCLGEVAYALVVKKKFDDILKVMGDDGSDVDGYDVKTSTYYNDPWLKHDPNSKKLPEKGFVLVGLNVKEKYAIVYGMATVDKMCFAEFVNWGNGDMLSIHFSQLDPINLS